MVDVAEFCGSEAGSEWRIEGWALRDGGGSRGGGGGTDGGAGEGDIDDAEFFGESGEAGGDVALGVDDVAAAVEDEFVVTADGVNVNDRTAESAGGFGDDEILPDAFFGVMPRTGGEVDHEVAFLIGELFDGHPSGIEAPRADHGVGPDILADGEADADAGVIDDGGGSGGLEVAVLVENIVGGQETFSADGNDGATVAERSGVVERTPAAGGVEFDGADDGGNGAGRSGDLGEGFGDIGDEAAFEQ